MDEEMVSRAEATARVLELPAPERPPESVPLDLIDGRSLAEPIVAPADVPPHDFATMDGFAFDATDAYPLTVVDAEVFPEDEPPDIGAGEAVEIATGAPLPHGANAVLKREEASVEDGRLTGEPVDPGTYTYRQGSNVEEGETLFRAGERLSPKDAILLRDLGIESVSVSRRLSVGVLATGTEIHEGRQADLDTPMLCGLVRSWGAEATIEGSVPDDYDRVEGRIAALADAHDVVFTTGGTSVGRKDYVVRALDALGEVHFHGVRVRPGKPIAIATLPDATAFAIPGKPVGAHTITTLVARPFFTGDATLPAIDATVSRDVDVPTPGFEYAVPVTIENDGDEAPTAMPLGHVDSPLQVYEETFDASVLSSSTRATRADGFFLVETGVTAGESVRVVPYPVIE